VIVVHRLGRLVATAVVTLSLAACSSGAAWSFAPSPAASPAPSSSNPSATPSASTTESADILGTIRIHAIEMAFHPSAITVSSAGLYMVEVTNGGTIGHDVTFDDGTVIPVAVGERKTGTVNVPANGIGFHCSVPGHADAGMTGSITVLNASAAVSVNPPPS
jgi:uncharacterized cupredoxin-like copper-binding protein